MNILYLLNETIKENILLGSEIDDDKLKQILVKANLYELIKSLPDGIDTKISSNGQEISGGERQRIAIARALVKDVDFIFVDESTSQLDPVNRTEIEKILLNLENVGVIMISHNFNDETLKSFDEIIDLKKFS
ncbi:MAG: ABC transporter ATP-binding protein [Erysipelotrichaceae bacterium]|nr:ABC transporter ATP-binding protein [Erysipelotrichaceae bacterium]